MLCITRAQAAGPWSRTACCAVSGNACRSACCWDHTSASDFLFRLQPGEPQRFLPTGTGSAATFYQYVGPDYWPTWGNGHAIQAIRDTGSSSPYVGYSIISCNHGDTYAGIPNKACGDGNSQSWGRTDLEVWYLVEEGV